MIHTLLLATALFAAPRSPDLTTFYEQSGERRTPSYAQTIAYCQRLAESSNRIHFTPFGSSGEGRDLPLVIVDRDGHTTPERARRAGRAIVLVQAGIHAGEIDGKDAGLMLARDLVHDASLSPILDRVTLVFIPILNVDGHERVSPYHRANQNGPEEMGFRGNASNLNLNRDYVKADAPEIRSWLRLFNAWMPDLFVDCHVTDGADYQYVVTYVAESSVAGDPQVAQWSREDFEVSLQGRMQAAGFPISPYCDFRRWHDPQSGLKALAGPPRFSTGYAYIRNRPALLIETHMIKDYATRVRGTYQMLLATLRIVHDESETLRNLVTAADAHAASDAFRDGKLVVNWTNSFDDSVMLDFLGYDYTVETSTLTGGDWYRYSDNPVTFRLPLYHRVTPTAEPEVPEAYVIPPQWTEVIERVDAHGLSSFRLRDDVTATVSSVKFTTVEWQAAPFEGRHPLNYTFDEVREERTLRNGSVVVETGQPAARVAVNLFEPGGADALVRWGFFDASFEQKEYVESYVMERLAREMLAADPQLARDFEAYREDAPGASPGEILNWFYQRSPYFDSRMRVYPVARITDRATLQRLRRLAR
jgi:hypothetical protein